MIYQQLRSNFRKLRRPSLKNDNNETSLGKFADEASVEAASQHSDEADLFLGIR